MEQNVDKIFKEIRKYPNETLSDSIWCAIVARESREYKIKSWGYTFIGLISLIVCIISVRDLVTKISTSGLYEYASLAFSDIGSISMYWKEFMLSLADSLPVTSIVFSLGTILVLFVSVQRGTRQFRNQLSLAS